MDVSENHLSRSLIAPIERAWLPAHLDGSSGANRAIYGRAQTSASNDLEAISAWVARYLDNKNTFASYRKEAERLVLWAAVERGKPMSSLTHEDLLIYQRFLSDPQPAERWVSRPGRKPGRQSPLWRPFVGGLSDTSRAQAMGILNAMFSWLVTAGYLAGNPLKLSKINRSQSNCRVSRVLSEAACEAIKNHIAQMPIENEIERKKAARSRWLFSLLYLCGLRISEVANNTMGGFYKENNKAGSVIWWLEVIGKGNKKRSVPVSRELMDELSVYRGAHGLSPTPIPNETTPLLIPVIGESHLLTRSAIHVTIKSLLHGAANRVESLDPLDTGTTAILRQSSAHWIRHTAATEMANGDIDIRHVRDNLGHSSIATTNRYLHSDREIRHSETSGRHKIKWDPNS